MTDEEKRGSALAADIGSTCSNSPAVAEYEGDIGHTPEPPKAESPTPITNHPNEVDVEATRQISRHGSVVNQPVKVPRLNRRGLFGQLTILAEVEEPTLYPRQTKWFITFVVAIAGMAAPLGSTIIFRENSVLFIFRTPTNHLHVQRHFPSSRKTLRPPRQLLILPSRSFF